MKKLLQVILVGGVVSATAFAAPVCVVDDLADYILLGAGGCMIGSTTFSNFSYTDTVAGGATQVTAANVTVTPLSSGSTIGLEFAGPWVASPFHGEHAIDIDYDVLDPSAVFVGTSISATFNTTNDATVAITKDLNGGALASVSLGGPSSATFGAVSGFSVGDLATLASLPGGATTSGTATLTKFRNEFVVPEPMTFVLFGSGLIGVGLLRRRIKKS